MASESDHTPYAACMCLAFDADSNEQGWRPCPPDLCEREDHQHHPDWLVTFAHKVAVERDLDSRHPGHRFCVMLNRKEAEGLLEHIMALVPDA
jgi:hypothetical protein